MRIILIISFVFLFSCNAKFDGYDPKTGIFKWVLTKEKKEVNNE